MHKQLQSRALKVMPRRAAELSWALAGDVDFLGFPSKGFSDIYKANMDTTGCVSESSHEQLRYNINIDILIKETSSISL